MPTEPPKFLLNPEWLEGRKRRLIKSAKRGSDAHGRPTLPPHDLKLKLVWMSPEEFFNIVSREGERQESIKEHIKRLKEGVAMGPLDIITYKGKVVHLEGRHRATAAKRLGVKKIPVLMNEE